MKRRHLIQAAVATTSTALLPGLARAQQRRFEPQPGAWRSFEMTMDIAVADHQGTTKVWLPVPDIETDYQRTLGHSWAGNAATMQLVSDAPRGVRIF